MKSAESFLVDRMSDYAGRLVGELRCACLPTCRYSPGPEGDDRSGEWCSDPSHRTPQLLFLPLMFGYERGFFFVQLTLLSRSSVNSKVVVV